VWRLGITPPAVAEDAHPVLASEGRAQVTASTLVLSGSVPPQDGGAFAVLAVLVGGNQTGDWVLRDDGKAAPAAQAAGKVPAVPRRTGFDKVYEGWIAVDAHTPRLVCVLFVELPAGLTAGDKLDVPVDFCGYYYKRYGNEQSPPLKSGERNLAPMLIGRTVR